MNQPVPFSKNSPRFSDEEQRRYRKIFDPIAKGYRAGSRFVLAMFAIGGALIVLGFFLPKSFIPFMVGGFVVCWFAIVIAALAQPALECPCCGGMLDRELDSYCPECGAANLKPGGWFQSPHCDACSKSLRRGKSRQYSIRACTHCGLILDETGL